MAAAVPELAGAVEDYAAEWDVMESEPGAINYSDEVLVPFIKRCLEEHEPLTGSLQRAFDFVEELASDEEVEIREVAQVTINSLSGIRRLDGVTHLMGQGTREMFAISKT